MYIYIYTYIYIYMHIYIYIYIYISQSVSPKCQPGYQPTLANCNSAIFLYTDFRIASKHVSMPS